VKAAIIGACAVHREFARAISNNVGSQADEHLVHSPVIGHEVMATDGPVGTIEDFVFDDSNWAIRHAVVAARKWLYSRQVLLPAESMASSAGPTPVLERPCVAALGRKLP
jgi:hypothetical protein